MNKAFIIGNLTRDPELRTTASGISVCTFTLAVNRPFANQQGVRETDFIPVVVWRKQAENCKQYLSKGRKCAVSGSIQTRSYDAQDGTKRYVTEIIAEEVEFLSTGSQPAGGQFDNGGYPIPEPSSFTPTAGNNSSFGGNNQYQKPENASGGMPVAADDDELPF